MKKEPKEIFTLESELDGDEWDLDSEDDEPPSFEDWLDGRLCDEMEKQVAEQLKATLLWQGPFDPTKKRNAGFNIIRDMNT